MSAFIFLHIRSPDITDDDMEIFFYNHPCSKYDPFTKVIEFMGEDREKILSDISSSVTGEFHDNMKARYPKLYDLWMEQEERTRYLDDLCSNGRGSRYDAVYEKIKGCTSICIGDIDSYGIGDRRIPNLEDICLDFFSDDIKITQEIIDELNNEISKCMKKGRCGFNSSDVAKLTTFLINNIGKKAFVVCW